MRPYVRLASFGAAALAVLVIALGSVLPGSSSAGDKKAERFTWNNTTFPASIRDQIHVTTATVPAYPMDEPLLKKPKNWPATMTIGGVLCARRIHGRGTSLFALESLKRLQPGAQLTLFYDNQSSRWDTGNAGWGPQYTWDGKKRLTQRIWYEPDSMRLARVEYSYYKNGRLLGYSWRHEPRHRSSWSRDHEFLSQFFDKDGHLMGACYEKMRPGSWDSVYVWMGTEIPYDNFRMKTHAFYSAAH